MLRKSLWHEGMGATTCSHAMHSVAAIAALKHLGVVALSI